MNSNPPINGTPHPRVGWGNSGDLTVPCQEPLPWGVTRCQYTYLSPRIDRGFDIIRLYYANSPCQFHLPSGGNSCQFPCIARGWILGGVIDRCIIARYSHILCCPLIGNLTTSSQGFSIMNTYGDSDSPPGYCKQVMITLLKVTTLYQHSV